MKNSLLTEVLRVVVVMGVMFGIFLMVINIFPELSNLSFAPKMVTSKVKDTSDYLNEQKRKSSVNLESYIMDFVGDNVSFDRFRENMFKRAAKAEKDSEKINNFVKKVTGNDLSKIASKYLTIDEDILRGKK